MRIQSYVVTLFARDPALDCLLPFLCPRDPNLLYEIDRLAMDRVAIFPDGELKVQAVPGVTSAGIWPTSALARERTGAAAAGASMRTSRPSSVGRGHETYAYAVPAGDEPRERQPPPAYDRAAGAPAYDRAARGGAPAYERAAAGGAGGGVSAYERAAGGGSLGYERAAGVAGAEYEGRGAGSRPAQAHDAYDAAAGPVRRSAGHEGRGRADMERGGARVEGPARVGAGQGARGAEEGLQGPEMDPAGQAGGRQRAEGGVSRGEGRGALAEGALRAERQGSLADWAEKPGREGAGVADTRTVYPAGMDPRGGGRPRSGR